MTRIGKLLERLIMSLTGRRVDQFADEATVINDGDFFGIAQDVGGGVFQTKKAKRKLLPDITVISRTTALVRPVATGGDDPELTFPVLAGVKYYVRTRLTFEIVTPNGIVSWGWTDPGLTVGQQDVLYFQAGGFGWKRGDNSGGPALFVQLSDALSNFCVVTDSLVLVPSADGVFTLNWAALNNTVTLNAGSYIEIVKVVP